MDRGGGPVLVPRRLPVALDSTPLDRSFARDPHGREGSLIMLRVAILSADVPPVPWGIASLMRDVARACSDEASVVVLTPRMRGAERFDRHEPYRVIRVANPAVFREASLIQSLLRLE